MITEWIVNVGIGIATWFLAFIPEWEPPAEFASFGDSLNGFINSVGGLGVWVPWGVLTFAVGLHVGSWLLGFGVRGFRVAASHVPFVGGNG